MRTTNTFSILFWTDQKNYKNNQALIYARITVNQKRVNIPFIRSRRMWKNKFNEAITPFYTPYQKI